MKDHGSEKFYHQALANNFIRKLQNRGVPYEIDYEYDYDLGFTCEVIIVRW